MTDVPGFDDVGGVEDMPPPPLKFTLLSLGDLFEREESELLIDGVLPQGALAVIYGAPKSFKTFVAISLAMSIATGVPWFGRAVMHGPVVYVIAEGVTAFPKRLRAWMQDMTSDVVAAAHEGFTCLDRPVRMLDAGDVCELIRAIERLPIPPKLIVIDTAARCFSGGDENTAEDMTNFVDAIDQLKRRFSATVLLAHHSGKDGKSMRGSSVLDAAADTVFKVVREESRLTLICARQKDAEEFEPLHFEMITVDLGADPRGRPVTSGRLVPADAPDAHARQTDADAEPARKLTARDRILAALNDAPDEGWMKVKDLVQAGCGKSSNLYGVLGELVETKVVEQGEHGYRRPREGGAS